LALWFPLHGNVLGGGDVSALANYWQPLKEQSLERTAACFQESLKVGIIKRM